jgi:hypothetical protein
MSNETIRAELALAKRILRAVRTKRTKVYNERQGPQNARSYDRLHGQEQAYSDVIAYLKPVVEDLTNNLDYAEKEDESN